MSSGKPEYVLKIQEWVPAVETLTGILARRIGKGGGVPANLQPSVAEAEALMDSLQTLATTAELLSLENGVRGQVLVLNRAAEIVAAAATEVLYHGQQVSEEVRSALGVLRKALVELDKAAEFTDT